MSAPPMLSLEVIHASPCCTWQGQGSEAEAQWGDGLSGLFLSHVHHFFEAFDFEIHVGEYELKGSAKLMMKMRVFFSRFLFHLGCFFVGNSKEARLGSGTTDSYLNECLTSLRGHH